MKKSIFANIIMIILLLLILSGCDLNWYIRPGIDSNIKWVSDEVDIWFIIDNQNGTNGEINIDNTKKEVLVAFDHGSGMFIFLIDENKTIVDLLISFNCKFYNDKIIATVEKDDDNIIGIGEKITFRKVIISTESSDT
jgi:hypothetical protein